MRHGDRGIALRVERDGAHGIPRVRARCEVEEDVGRLLVQRMWPARVVELDVAADAGFGLTDRLVGVEVDLLVFDRSPEPFDEDVVSPSPRPSMLILIRDRRQRS